MWTHTCAAGPLVGPLVVSAFDDWPTDQGVASITYDFPDALIQDLDFSVRHIFG